MVQRNSDEVEVNGEFQHKFLQELFYDCYEFQENNTDFLRLGVNNVERYKRKVKDKLLAFIGKKGFIRKPYDSTSRATSLLNTLNQIDGLERTYYLLQDSYSRQLLLGLLKFRILGARHVKLPLNDKEFWREYTSIDKRFLKERRTIKTSWDWYLNLYELQGNDAPLKLHVTPLGVLNTFVLEQYAYQKSGQSICVKEGDVIIDGGGCWGDTALYFADKAGARGKVYCFEFDQENLNILQKNLALNPPLDDIIKVVPKAMWDKSGEAVNYCANGPGTSLNAQQQHQQQPTAQVTTLTIDDLVREEGLGKVNYIKMDIEGAELKALRGAEATLRAFRPTLAISLYHNEDDFVAIPAYLNGLDGLQYEFFLDHFTIHHEETVLFARPKSK